VIVTPHMSGDLRLSRLRIVMGIALPKTARLLSRSRLQSDINVVAARAAMAALTDPIIPYPVTAERKDRQNFLNMATHACGGLSTRTQTLPC